jgi:hypothetical protein
MTKTNPSERPSAAGLKVENRILSIELYALLGSVKGMEDSLSPSTISGKCIQTEVAEEQ